MATAPEFTEAQQKRAPVEESEQEKFLAILNNRGKSDTTGNLAVRRNGFVVLVRGAKNLKSVQSLCFSSEQSWNTCLTARYRLQSDAVLGTLLAAFIADLRQIQRGEPNGLLGEIHPEPADSAWQSFLSGPLSSLIAEWPEEQKGNLAREQLDKLWEILSDGTTLASGTRLVLFGEVNSRRFSDEKFPNDPASRPISSESNFQTKAPAAKFPESPDAEESEWKQITEAFGQQLPERTGFVFAGAPEDFHLPANDPHFLEINLPEEGSGDGPTASERLYKYKLPPIHSDRVAREDRLGINAYAEALGRFVLHPQTQAPLTIGIHGPWGKGKSSFMELIDIALVKWANVNRSTRTQTLADLQTAIERKQAEAEVAGEKELAQMTNDLASAINRREILWQDMQRAAAKELLTVRFNAWQFEDAKQIWAGLASVISERLERALSWPARMRMRVVYAWRKHRAALLLNLFLPIAIALLVGIYLLFGGAAKFQNLTGESAGKDLPALGDLLKTLLPTGSILFLLWLITWRLLKVLRPVSARVLNYIELPSYREQMGYQHRVMDDLRFVYNRFRAPRPKAVIYIDDLDRCSEEKIMEILQAINLILGNSEFFVFLGMDTEMIHRAIRVHYRQNQADEPLPADFPENYLRKIVQLSFHLPETPPEKRFTLVSTLFSASARRELEQQLERDEKPETGETGQAETTADGFLPFDLTLLQKPIRQELKEVEDTAEELAAFGDYQEFLEDNPREIKRLVNVHRLVKIILQREGITWPVERQRKLVKWLIFCARWPELIDDLLVETKKDLAALNPLEQLLDKLAITPAEGKAFQEIKAFAGHLDILSPADIDADFSLAAQVCQMVRESPAPLKKAGKQYGYQAVPV
ncbi:KAP family NTPase [candidate division KSB1 bacterium]|nr:KAP family NTPase [candidate division KSB1 bacterium]